MSTSRCACRRQGTGRRRRTSSANCRRRSSRARTTSSSSTTSSTGRKLTWQTCLGNADVGKVRVQLVHAQRHHLPNVHPDEVQLGREHQHPRGPLELGIPQQELKRTSSPGARRATASLRKAEGQGNWRGIFTVNESYTSKLKRVKVPLVSAKETSTSSTFFVYAMRCFSQYTKKFSHSLNCLSRL